MERVECSNCGSVYGLTSTKIGMRDKDSINCEVCGNEIYSWNEAKMWNERLLERKENHLKTNDEDGFFGDKL